MSEPVGSAAEAVAEALDRVGLLIRGTDGEILLELRTVHGWLVIARNDLQTRPQGTVELSVEPAIDPVREAALDRAIRHAGSYTPPEHVAEGARVFEQFLRGAYQATP